MEIFWFIPTYGDGRYIGTRQGSRLTTSAYFRQIAIAADDLGYSGVLLPTGRSCEDAWVTASMLAADTARLKFLVAIRPGLMTPALAARMASTFDRLSGGRLLINVVAGGDPVELAAEGITLGHDERYALTDEFLTVWRKLLQGELVEFHGSYISVQQGENFYPPLQQPYPPIFFGGSSPAGIEVASKHADVYLTWGEPPKQVQAKMNAVREQYAKAGRTVRFGIRLHVIVRESEEEAWTDARRLVRHLDPATVAQAQAVYARMDSHGQRRMTALHGGGIDNLEIGPNLWAGIGLVRGGAGTALVGSPESVADRLKEYAALGIETFILSGYPHLEEAHRVAELLFPLLPLNLANSESDSVQHAARAAQSAPSGEVVAYSFKPDSTS